MNIDEQGHVTLSAFPVLSEGIHIAPKSAADKFLSASMFFYPPVTFDVNMRKRRRFTPQQVLDEIFADEDKI